MTTLLPAQDSKTFAIQLVKTWQKYEVAKTEKTRDKYYQECLSMCELKQKQLLNNGYSEVTLIKTLTSQYRKAIAIQAGKFDDSIKGGYRYTEYPMAFWKINQNLRQDIDAQTKVSVGEKKKDAVRITLECREKLLSLANQLLELPMIEGRGSGQLVYKKALAIALLTGRRFYVEVCRNADFGVLSQVEDFNRKLAFSGQAKGGKAKSEQIYKIPTFAENPELMINNLELVQSFISAKPWYSEDLNAREFQSRIKKECELALKDFQNICREHGFLITIKDLRAIYMAFAYYDYRVLSGKHPDHDTYVGSIAGHDAQSEDGSTYYRVGMTEHYKGFIDARWDNF